MLPFVGRPTWHSSARAHNDANVLSMPGRLLTEEEIYEILVVFLNTPFEGEASATNQQDPLPLRVRIEKLFVLSRLES